MDAEGDVKHDTVLITRLSILTRQPTKVMMSQVLVSVLECCQSWSEVAFAVSHLSHCQSVKVKAHSMCAVPHAAYMVGLAGPTWKVTVYAFVPGIPARPLLRQLLQASLEIEVVSEDCSIFRGGSIVASGNDLILHVTGYLLHFDLQKQHCLRLQQLVKQQAGSAVCSKRVRLVAIATHYSVVHNTCKLSLTGLPPSKGLASWQGEV